MTDVYRSAFSEVYEILNHLSAEDYDKIPEEIILGINDNRDENYVFTIDENLSLKDQAMLDETRAILFSLYVDYLAPIEKKEKIISYKREEDSVKEKLKSLEYLENNSNDAFYNNQTKLEEHLKEDTKALTNIKENNSIFDRIINFIKRFFKK